MWWLIGAIIIALVVIDAVHDMRKLRIGIGLVLIATWLVFSAIGLAAASRDDDSMTLAWSLFAILVLALFSILLLGLFNVANGFTMLRRERRRFANLLSLVFGLGLTAAVAYIVLGILMDSWSRDIAFEMFRWLLFLSLPLGYLSLIFVAFFVQSTLYGWLAPHLSRKADAVIVLGAGLSDGEVTPLLASRLDRGKQVFARVLNPEAVLIASGGQGPDEPRPEAEAMADYLREAGVESARIVEENQSRTTEENLTFSAGLLHERGVAKPRCLTVTNNYHAMRAALLMRKLTIAGHAIGSPTARYYWPSAFLREYVAVLRDHAKIHAVMLALASLPILIYILSSIARWFG